MSDVEFGDPDKTQEPKLYKIRYEMVYRVWTETEVTEENYASMDEQAAFAEAMEDDEATIYENVFEEEISANGPDGAYILVQLVHPDGHVVRQGVIEGRPSDVQPTYLVNSMEHETPS
jgi:hypothetical protein